MSTRTRNKNGLTPQQQAFADLYLADPDRNGAAAYRVAYPTCKSPRAADTGAARLLTHAKIKAFIDKRLQALTSKVELKQERVLQELASIAFLDPGELLNDEGDLKPLQDLPPHVRAAIASFEIVTNRIGSGEDAEIEYIRKVRFHPKAQAIDMAMKYFKLYSNELNLNVKGSVEVNHRLADDMPFDRIKNRVIEGKAKRVAS